jgi:eukaryotic-like serine/threonine-protein kinase
MASSPLRFPFPPSSRQRPPTPIDQRAGLLVADRYVIERRLGSGGAGVVWSACDSRTDRSVAVKFLDRKLVSSADALARFEREVAAVRSIASRHVVRLLDHGDCPWGPFMVLEELAGEDLGVRLDREPVLPLRVACGIAVQMLSGVADAHAAGVVHRDLKPENVFLAGHPGAPSVRILDFGIASLDGPATSRKLTIPGSLLGTLEHMSPEQLLAQPTDSRSDLFSLAVVVFRAFTGRLPFPADTLGERLLTLDALPPRASQLRSELPAALDVWFTRALARHPADRFPSAVAMREAFITALRTASGSMPTVGGREEPPPSLHVRRSA